MASRRQFLRAAVLGAAAVGAGAASLNPRPTAARPPRPRRSAPSLAVATWNHGVPANAAAWRVLAAGGHALDAVQEGVMVVEADPTISTVGLGGYPDRDGRVTLDAAIMDGDGGCGAVACLENIVHPVAVARRIMERTPHVMLVGEGALQFARDEGFPEQNLLTPAAEQAWREWLQESRYEPRIDGDRHDTIGMLVRDMAGGLAGACSTSGLAFKLPGRVGDSPIIGAGLFVDSSVGAACTTGLGELAMKTLSSFLMVEKMREGAAPQEACEAAVARILSTYPAAREDQLCCLAMTGDGAVGAFSILPGFQYAVADPAGNVLHDAPSRFP